MPGVNTVQYPFGCGCVGMAFTSKTVGSADCSFEMIVRQSESGEN
jgi:hypothetical protein